MDCMLKSINMDDTLKFDDNLMKKAPFFKIWVGLAKKEKAFFYNISFNS